MGGRSYGSGNGGASHGMGGDYSTGSDGGTGGFARSYGSEFGSSAQGLSKFRRLNGTEWKCTNMEGSYSKFFDAMKACSSDSSCQGIHDNGCKSKRSKYNLDLQLCTALANSADSGASCIYQKIQENKNGNSANGMQGGYGSGSGRINHGIEGEYGLELVGGARYGYATGSGIGGEDVSYKHIEASKAFCKSPQNGDWTTQELKSKRPDLSWYIDYGNGVCHIGNNGGVEKCARICKDIDGCRYFSVSTTTSCYACFIYKTCDNPISSKYDYKIYEMIKGGSDSPRLDSSFFGCHGSKIALKTQYSSHKYILALPDRRSVNANGTSTENGIIFEVEDYGANPSTNERIIALKSIYGNYLSASECKNPSDPSNPKCDVTADSNSAEIEGAKFEVKHNQKNQYWFQTHWTLNDTLGREKPLYLKPYSNGNLKGDGTRYDLRKWAKFTPECVEAYGNGGITMEESYKSGNGLKGMTNVEGGSGLIKTCDPNKGYNFNPNCSIGQYCTLRKVSGGKEAWLCI